MFTLNTEVKRHCSGLLGEMLDESPIVVIQGARQVGKSTLARQVTERCDAWSVSLDDTDVAALARSDPRGFVGQAPGRLLVLDEAQREPTLTLALKMAVDRNRRPGQFLITGSADFLRLKTTGDSLAGRAEILTLRPLSMGELQQRRTPEDWVSWILAGAPGRIQAESPEATRECIISGGYPLALSRRTPASRQRWFNGYLQSIATKDAEELSGGDFPGKLPQLLRLLAAEGVSEYVAAKMARHLGVSEKTLGGYFDLAHAMYLVEALPAWGVGISKRVIRRPKVSLVDSGLAAVSVGMTVEKSRLVGGMEYFGALTEQFVAGELRKQREWTASPFDLYHYRHRDQEVDIVIELPDGRLILVEVKSGLSVPKGTFAKLEQLIPGDRVVARVVLYLGEQSLKIAPGNYLLPISSLWTHPDSAS